MNHDTPDPLHGLDPKKLAQGALDENAPDPNQAPDGLRERLAELLPDFDIGECLGRGGMGAVFRAQQRKLDRSVAIKVLLPAPNDTLAWQERFEREARALALLSHPNIIQVFDFGQAEELCYLVTEYVDGVNLRTLLRDGKLDAKEALAIVPQLCDALRCAHEQGVVHRDIKPENVLIGLDGNIKVADFGLAKLTGGSAPLANLTLSSQAMGTLRYMAPEQLDAPREVDHRADIYSLGVVFYEMLTGEIPAGHFQAPSKKVSIDVRLDEVVLKAMQSEPERRYQHVSELKTKVDEIEASPKGRGAFAERERRRARDMGVRERRAKVRTAWSHLDGTPWFAPMVAAATCAVLVVPGVLESTFGNPSFGLNGTLLSLSLNIVFVLSAGAMFWHGRGRVTTLPALITRLTGAALVLATYAFWEMDYKPYRVTDWGTLVILTHIVLLLGLTVSILARLAVRSLSASQFKMPVRRHQAPPRSLPDQLRLTSVVGCFIGAATLLMPWGVTFIPNLNSSLAPATGLRFGWETGHAIAAALLFLFPGIFRMALIRLSVRRPEIESGVAIALAALATIVTSSWLFYYSGLHLGSLVALCMGTLVALVSLLELTLPKEKLNTEPPS